MSAKISGQTQVLVANNLFSLFLISRLNTITLLVRPDEVRLQFCHYRFAVRGLRLDDLDGEEGRFVCQDLELTEATPSVTPVDLHRGWTPASVPSVRVDL